MTDEDQALHGSEGESLVETFATFLKATFVYPENNVRVRDAQDRCFETVRHALVRGDSVVIKAGAGKVVGMGTVLEAPLTPMVDWLRATFESTALAGVEFLQELEQDDLVEFARRLRHNFTTGRRNPTFADLWSDPVSGLRLIEPRFRGRFTAEAHEGDPADFPDSPATQSVRFARSVEQHPGITEKLKSLQHQLASNTTSDTLEIDVVAQIINILPEEVRNNPVALIKTVESILTLTTDELRQLSEQQEWTPDLDFRRLLIRICQTFFVREDQGETDSVEEKAQKKEAEEQKKKKDDGPRGHKGDDLISDDLGALMDEIAPLELPPDDVTLSESQAEQLGVCVHQLLTTEDKDHLGNVKPRLVELLGEPGPEDLRIVRESISPSSRESRSPDRLIQFLADANLTGVLSSTLVLPRKALIRDFPHNFCLLVDTVDTEDAEAMQRFAEIAGAIGRDRILHRAGTLLKEGLLTSHRVEKILSGIDAALLPFAEIVIQHGDKDQRRQVVQFLRKMNLTTAGAEALSIDDTLLPAPFLLSLCQTAQDVPTTSGLKNTAVNLLKEFISQPVSDATGVQRRAIAVHAFRKLWSDEVAVFLGDVAKFGLFSSVKVAKPIRAAARDLLRQRSKK